MEFAEKVKITRENIRTAVKDYWKYTKLCSYVKSDMSEDFIYALAEDSVLAKQELRDMLRKSPAWNEELDALVINGNVTHDPDWAKVMNLANTILYPAYQKAHQAFVKTLDTKYAILKGDIDNIVKFFSQPSLSENEKEEAIKSMERIDPRAYVPGKKPSRVFKALCVALGVADEVANSDFQRLFAKIADEMSAKKINFKLFLSINPAHFITMSNPKEDSRGSCMTSCHSFNSTDYEYNNGCAGYARDSITMIAFTVSDPDNPETLNNRKTTRQLFMYQPGSGVLMQSRMYNTSGGTTGAQEESKLYRKLVQEQIALCENAVNYWVTKDYEENNKYNVVFCPHDNFGGYCDWEYDSYNPKLSIRTDHIVDCKDKMFTVGAAGLCVSCGRETQRDDKLYCNKCEPSIYDGYTCEHCGRHLSENECWTAYDEYGNQISVCEDCLDEYYSYCEDCEEYVHESNIRRVYDATGRERWVCDDCCSRNYTECEECGEYYEKTYDAINKYGDECQVCEGCMEDKYSYCEECENTVHYERMCDVHDENGNGCQVCEYCCDENYEQCKECEEYYPKDCMENNLCPDCYEEKHEQENEMEVA